MRFGAAAAACIACLASPSGRALANGAFPDAERVLALPERPHQLILGTNFGLARSEDDGATWTWACEQNVNGLRDLYQFGAPPRRRLFARDIGPLAMTDDGGCTWQAAGGGVGAAPVTDAFPDPTDPGRVLAVAAPATITDGSYSVRYLLYESRDGGGRFDTVRYRAAPGDLINSVEIAASAPNVVYMIVLRGPTLLPILVTSTNGGASWSETDLSPALGAGSVLIIAVDPGDPRRIFFRVNASGRNQLAVTDDGGSHVRVTFTLAGGFLTGFARLGPSTVVLSGVVGDATVLFRSRNGGETFDPVPNPPRLWSLSQRGDVLYGAGQTAGAFAAGVSTDEGTTWRSLLRYDQIRAVDACAQAACRDACQLQVDRGLFPQAVCAAPAPQGSAYGDSLPRDPDGGADADAGLDAAATDAGDDGADAAAGGAGGTVGAGGAAGASAGTGAGGAPAAGSGGGGANGAHAGCGCAVPAAAAGGTAPEAISGAGALLAALSLRQFLTRRTRGGGGGAGSRPRPAAPPP